MAEFATGDADEALDIVQDAMMKFAEKYGDRDPDEWTPMFYRILQSRITDWHRRRRVRSRILSFVGFAPGGDEAAESLIERAQSRPALEPEVQLDNEQMIERLKHRLTRLPLRQQQAFLLRMWEGLDVRQTAQAMSCSEGSVKTHYSRALATLRAYIDGTES